MRRHDPRRWPRLCTPVWRARLTESATVDAGLPTGSEGAVVAQLGPAGPYLMAVDGVDDYLLVCHRGELTPLWSNPRPDALLGGP